MTAQNSMSRVSFFCRCTAAALCLFLAQGVMSPPLSAAFKNVAVGDTPPAFSLSDLDGREWQSTEFYGKSVTAVVFWAAWSPRSREVLDDLQKLKRELAPKEFRIIAINAEHVDISTADMKLIRQMTGELEFDGLTLLDQGLAAYNAFGAMALPSTLVLDGKGKVSFELAGYPTTMRSDLSDAIKKALGLPTSVELRPDEGYKPKNHALMYFNFGKRLMEKGQEEKAEAQLLISVERDPAFTRPRILLGVYYKKTGLLDKALEHFREVKKLDPANVEAVYQEAVVSLKSGDFAAAEGLFAGLHEEFPAREEFALALALALKYQGREEEYAAAKAKADSLLPAAPRMHYELGAVAESQGDLEVAAPLYHRAIEGALKKK